MAGSSPTQRTLAECKKRKWTAQVVERWNPYAKVRIDLFGFVDVVALTGTEVLAIQATTTGNAPARVAKITSTCALAARQWLQSGGAISVWGWALRGASGKRKTYELKCYPVTLADLDLPKPTEEESICHQNK